ncbi:sialate O-acetylesterase [Pectobacterium carotovorum subsp. carotovorum]|nr:sialate O-acetylesterase [Pectobacterium carotovorum subsp. carotovorum]
MKKTFTASVLINVIFLLLSLTFIYKKGGIDYIKGFFFDFRDSNALVSDHHVNRLSIFEQSIFTQAGGIVFLGDSLTNNVSWGDFFEGKTFNRGIGGDTTAAVLNRVDEVVKLKPKIVFLLVGVNDIQSGVSINETVNNYRMIIESLTKNDIKVVAQGILPVNHVKYEKHIIAKFRGVIEPDVAKVENLNAAISKISSEFNGVSYLPLDALLDIDGQINDDFTIDGIHLNGKGVRKWVEILTPIANK